MCRKADLIFNSKYVLEVLYDFIFQAKFQLNLLHCSRKTILGSPLLLSLGD